MIQRNKPAHYLASKVILYLLSMMREAIGPVIQSCSTLIEHETDPLTSDTSPGSILTYESIAPLLAGRYTAMNNGIARLLWTDLHAT